MDFFEPFAISNEPASLHDGSESEHMQMLVDQNEFDHDLTMPITQFEGADALRVATVRNIIFQVFFAPLIIP
jgi:hypothetical protein